ncbi:ribonuclease H-like domain-containing protein [Tribonema minus]|uniref:Ribonuclease n=1 Tax=Tribonema minus TaxID=303371 RepID=A0A835YL34_9STRA|nr:ribonuclease H-like domain-containing protein [Tribonema minus]
MGIDEAGRGPVLGPMTYGAAYWSMNDDEAIKKLGYDDSKALSEDKREKLYKGIMAEQRIGWVLRVLGARELSARMLRRAPHSLNAISHAAAAEMIRHALGRAVALTHVYVDTVGDPDNYARALRREFPGIGFTVAKKADSLYKTVSAASICAKVVRDRALARWRYREPGVFAGDAAARAYGSGYPGDARCSAWLRSHVDTIFGFPDVARFSWSTARDLLEAAAAKVEWEEEEEGDVQGGFGGPQGAPKLDAFFTRSGQAPRTQYFKRARIERTYAF